MACCWRGWRRRHRRLSDGEHAVRVGDDRRVYVRLVEPLDIAEAGCTRPLQSDLRDLLGMRHDLRERQVSRWAYRCDRGWFHGTDGYGSERWLGFHISEREACEFRVCDRTFRSSVHGLDVWGLHRRRLLYKAEFRTLECFCRTRFRAHVRSRNTKRNGATVLMDDVEIQIRLVTRLLPRALIGSNPHVSFDGGPSVRLDSSGVSCRRSRGSQLVIIVTPFFEERPNRDPRHLAASALTIEVVGPMSLIYTPFWFQPSLHRGKLRVE